MTASEALLIRAMEAYAVLGYAQTLLEVQKLAYFLQEAGEPLRLQYEPGHYGPYAHTLNKVLEAMEGHFIRGYGDSQRPGAEIDLLPGAVQEASAFLDDKPESLARLARVAELIEGFEPPYGMELLATVHWVNHRGGPNGEARAVTPVEATARVHDWSARKRQLLKPEQIQSAWEQLEARGWLADVGGASAKTPVNATISTTQTGV